MALEVAQLLRAASHTAVTARDLGREGSTDDEHLFIASKDDRIFLTHGESDFILLHHAWQRWSEGWGVATHHGGILIAPQGRRYGINWDAEEIAQAVIACIRQCSPVAERLFRRKEAGWERRDGRDWVPCG